MIKAWSQTQAVLAKSHAESELYGVVRGDCDGLAVNTLLRDLGQLDHQFCIPLDATEARPIVDCKGLSEVRHMDTDVLWLQGHQARRLLPLNEVLGTENMSVRMSKQMSATAVLGYLKRMGLQNIEGRSDIAQELHAITLQFPQDKTQIDKSGHGVDDRDH